MPASEIPPLKLTPAERAVRPFVQFAAQQASSGVVLISCGLLAFALANSPLSPTIHDWWAQYILLKFGQYEVKSTLHHLINDGLMAVFFFLVGLEIKREFKVGELSTLKKASLPMIAAAGGMVVPALIYLAFNRGTPGARGFGIPTATDIAFALGVLALLGSRVPTSLKVILTALAIVDDIGAVIVIALFYSKGLQGDALGAMAAVLAVMHLLSKLGARSTVIYMGLFALLWFFTLQSGLHATLSGVLAAFAVPAKSRVDGERFLARMAQFTEEFRQSGDLKAGSMITEEQEAAVHGIERNLERVTTPLQRLIQSLHPWVAFGIMPLFALVNAGVDVRHIQVGELTTTPVFLGVALGLLLGKPLGILLAVGLGLKLKVCELPSDVSARHMVGMSILAGIGFTMSLFISELAFGVSAQSQSAKIAILLVSVLASLFGALLLALPTRGKAQ